MTTPPTSPSDNPPGGGASNKRRSPRFVVEGVQGKMMFASQVEVVNLSLGGVAIKADRRLNVGADYMMRLQLGERPVSIKGIVAWSTLTRLVKRGKDTVPEYAAGLKFTDVLTEKLLGLLEFIDNHKVSDEHRLGGIRFEIKTGQAEIATASQYRVRLVSLTGMLIETDQVLAVDSVHLMEIHPAGVGVIRVRGRVASVVPVKGPNGEARCEMGIEFLQMGDDDHARLSAFVEAAAVVSEPGNGSS
jgi:Tfp pilus assembly protein PilZ